jgi:Ftsk gamma domain
MAGRAKNQTTVEVIDETALDKVIAVFVSKALVLAPPWLVEGIGVAATLKFHGVWGGSAWWAIGLLPPTGLLTYLAWEFSHHRSMLRRLHVTLTTATAGVWFAYATEFGPFGSRLMAYATVVGGTTVALTWNLATVIREQGGGRGEDTLRELFGEQAEVVGLPGSRMHTLKATAVKVVAKLHLVKGEKVAEDVQKKGPYIESALALPPGSVTVSTDLDRADHVDVVISDPRTMRRPIPWPGPSRPGASIAEPLRPGVFQDGEEVELVIVGSHVQVMGKTGAGKSIGCAWDTLAEIFTRPDAAVFAIDLVKGEQTLGPLRPGLHRFETKLEGAQDLLTKMAAELETRTNQLAEKGLVEWEPGCGLPYWVLWIEEAWKLFDKIKMDAFESMMKALRSAGGSCVFSLQRSDHSQVPTLVRGQSSFWCFGVQVAKDASFGLSDEQEEAGARPELWGHNYPGMSYIDAPSIPRERIAMAVRTFNWAKDTGAVRAHAEQYPARDKPIDPVTAALARFSDTPPNAGTGPQLKDTLAAEEVELLTAAAELVVAPEFASTAMLQRKLRVGFEKAGELMAMLEQARIVGPEREGDGRQVLVDAGGVGELLAAMLGTETNVGTDDEEVDAVTEHVKTPDPDPDITATVGADDPIEVDPEDEPFEFASKPGEKLPADAAVRAVLDQLTDWADAGRTEFATRDLRPVWERTGWSRPWIIGQVKKLIDEGVLEDGEDGGYVIVRAPERA